MTSTSSFASPSSPKEHHSRLWGGGSSSTTPKWSLSASTGGDRSGGLLHPSRQASLPVTYPSTSSSSSYFRSYLFADPTARSPDLEGQGVRARSPRTPSTAQFEPTLSIPTQDHHLYPSAYTRSRSTRSSASSRIGNGGSGQRDTAPSSPLNVPSKPIPREGLSLAISRRIVRLIGFMCLIALGVMYFTKGRGFSSHNPWDGRPGSSAQRRHAPPQVYSAGMMERATPAPARSTRTGLSFAPHPIPSTHEFLAIQSYLLESPHNVLPAHTDPSKPLDGNTILAISPSKIGRPRSAAEASWLKDLEREREEDLVIWVPAGSGVEVEGMLDLLEGLTIQGRSPALVQMEGRGDAVILGQILARLGVKLTSKGEGENGRLRPLIMLGNEPIRGGKAELGRMKKNGELQEALRGIGWLDEWKASQLALMREDEENGHFELVPEVAREKVKPKIMNAGFKQ